MAVTLTIAQLATALRVGTSTEEAEILTRLLAASTETVGLYAPSAPDAIANEAVVRLAGYLYDQPNVGGRGTTNALRNSGATALLAQWRVQRATLLTGETLPDGSPAGVSLTGEQIATLLDAFLGSQDWRTGGVGGVVDAVARAAASGARVAADEAMAAATQAQTEVDAVEVVVDGLGVPAKWAKAGDSDIIPPEKISDAQENQYLGVNNAGVIVGVTPPPAIDGVTRVDFNAHTDAANAHHTPPTGGDAATWAEAGERRPHSNGQSELRFCSESA